MAGFPRKERQKIISGYMNETGRNYFIPIEFLTWLQDKPDNPAYDLFYGTDESTLAMERRVDMCRNWVSGLRLTVKEEIIDADSVVHLNIREVPAFISPLDSRKTGGGYIGSDPDDPAWTAEMKRQGIRDLKAWASRYGDVFGAEAQPIFDWLEDREMDKAS